MWGVVLRRSIWLNSVIALLALGTGTYSVIGLVYALWVSPPSCDDKTIVMRIADEIGARYDPREILTAQDGLDVLLLPYLEHLPHRVRIVSISQASMDGKSRICELDGHLYFDDDVAHEAMRLARQDPFISLPRNEEQSVRPFDDFSALLQAGYHSRLRYRVLYDAGQNPGYEILSRDYRPGIPK